MRIVVFWVKSSNSSAPGGCMHGTEREGDTPMSFLSIIHVVSLKRDKRVVGVDGKLLKIFFKF